MDDPADVAGRVIEAVNWHDIGTLRGLYAADGRTRRPGWPDEGGPEALLASYEMDFACVPDIHFAPVSTLSDGPHVVTELRITGTNTGPTVRGDFGKALLGADGEEVRATGRSIDLPAVSCTRSGTSRSVPIGRCLPIDRLSRCTLRLSLRSPSPVAKEHWERARLLVVRCASGPRRVLRFCNRADHGSAGGAAASRASSGATCSGAAATRVATFAWPLTRRIVRRLFAWPDGKPLACQ